jgi:hypothetical protein
LVDSRFSVFGTLPLPVATRANFERIAFSLIKALAAYHEPSGDVWSTVRTGVLDAIGSEEGVFVRAENVAAM